MELQLDPLFQTITLVVLVLILVADLLIILKRPHIPRRRSRRSGSCST